MKHYILAAILIGGASTANAEPCTGSVNIGQVCQLYFPVNSPHLRDCTKWKGCEKSFRNIIEMPVGYLLMDYDIDKQGGFGAANLSCDRSSDMTGSVTTAVTERTIEELTEIKGKLQAEAATCQPTGCSEIQGEIASVNRTIDTLRSVEHDVFTYGNNAGLRCKGELRVSFGGKGAKWEGQVITNARYVGTPDQWGRLVNRFENTLEAVSSQ